MQLLKGVQYMHERGVIHRDLKPSNCLINYDSTLKICDLGLARNQNLYGPMTEYVVTRWYRAPELLISQDMYGPEIDIWAVGCIFGELLAGTVLFPGKNYLEQLRLIVRFVGTPSEEDLEFVGNDRAKAYIRDLAPRSTGVSLEARFPTASAEARDLLVQLLRFDPSKRITAKVSYFSGARKFASETGFSVFFRSKMLSTITVREKASE